jgi:hypothetical protein
LVLDINLVYTRKVATKTVPGSNPDLRIFSFAEHKIQAYDELSPFQVSVLRLNVREINVTVYTTANV